MLKSLIPQLKDKHIIVIGDVILDEYLIGRATRMSREAPVPVLEYESRQLIPGGAANPAANIVALGGTVSQIGVIGDDEFAAQLCDTLQQRGIDTSGLITDSTRPTTVKTRIMAQMGLRFPQQVARLDRIARLPISEAIQQQILTFLLDHLSTADAILCSDYRAGLLTPALVDVIRQSAPHTLLTADAQGELAKYSRFTLVKCNAAEASDYLSRPLKTDEDFAAAARDLCQALQLTGAMVITRGADGASVATASGEVHHCPAPAMTDVFDTVGAGDTAIAVLTLSLTAGATYDQAATLANYASGIVVRRVGNYTPTPDELLAALG